MTYELILNLDGQELPPSTISGSEAVARDTALLLLNQAIGERSPKAAFCAVFDGVGEGTEPLGAWSYNREDGELPVWEGED